MTHTSQQPRSRLSCSNRLRNEVRRLCSTDAGPICTAARDALVADARVLAAASFDPEEPASTAMLHQVLYDLYSRTVQPPWVQRTDPSVVEALGGVQRVLEHAWDAEEARAEALDCEAAVSPDTFVEWTVEHVAHHASNAQHPLFPYLRDEASLPQLRDFLHQEGAFDELFGDILALMLPGLRGSLQAEVGSNLHDELGGGVPEESHLRLRLRLSEALGLPPVYGSDPTVICTSQLALANTYLRNALDRSRLPVLIGMMTATEVAVPGRIQCVLDGFRRVGVPEADLHYLALHTVIDVEHAEGWIANVVDPLLSRYPRVLTELQTGVQRRLRHAAAVCDDMLRWLSQDRALAS